MNNEVNRNIKTINSSLSNTNYQIRTSTGVSSNSLITPANTVVTLNDSDYANYIENSSINSNGSNTIYAGDEHLSNGKYGNSMEKDQLDVVSEMVYTDLIDDVIFGLLLQMHRAAKLGYLMYIDPDPDNDPEFEKQYKIYDDNDVLGVFSNLNDNNKINSGGSNRNGQNSINSILLKYECPCPKCGRNSAAIRFAPHLEKCMGMGRSSSRIATRRIANYNGDELDQLIEATGYITNHRYVEPQITSSNNNNNNSNSTTNGPTTNSDDLMSIINAVATASSLPLGSNEINSSTSSLIDIDISSNSSNCSLTNNNYLKPPNAKKKRLTNSKSNATSSASSSATTTTSSSSIIAPAPGVQSSTNSTSTLHNLNTNTNQAATTTIGANTRLINY